jgi:hypothetical protein
MENSLTLMVRLSRKQGGIDYYGRYYNAKKIAPLSDYCYCLNIKHTWPQGSHEQLWTINNQPQIITSRSNPMENYTHGKAVITLTLVRPKGKNYTL